MYLLEAPKNIAREDRFDQAQFTYKNLAIKPKRSITTFNQVFFKIKKGPSLVFVLNFNNFDFMNFYYVSYCKQLKT